MINVLVVDDSLTVRKKVVNLLENDPELTVVGEAKNGQEAFELVKMSSPGVIIMDIVMPVMDGHEATELIMAYHPTPIIIHSASANRGEDYKTMDALSSGALDFVEKNSDSWEGQLLFRAKRAARIKVVTHLRKKRPQKTKTAPVSTARITPRKYDLLVVGASTGGPKVVLDIVSSLPRDFPIPVIVVIHLAEDYKSSLCKWLNDNTAFDVRNATNGERFKGSQGIVYLAPPGQHLIVENGNLRLTSTAEVNFCRPSIDVLFESVAGSNELRAIAVLLTGMGRDGAAGLKAIKDGGGYTIAQDKSTSIAFGMPGRAAEIGAATEVLPGFDIPGKVLKLAKGKRNFQRGEKRWKPQTKESLWWMTA